MRHPLKFVLLVMIVGLLLPSCKKEGASPGNFTMQVKAKYGSEPFALYNAVTDPQGRKVKIETFKFYLSHIKLIKTDNTEIELKDIILCDLDDSASLILNADKVQGDFKAIQFSCGVDSIKNAMVPSDFANNHPLGTTAGMYWDWLKYQFQVIDARCDTGAGSYNLFLHYHIGGNALYRTATLNKSFSVCCGNTEALNLVLDVKKIFYGNQTLDIVAEPETQSRAIDNPVIAPKFAGNFSQAFFIE